MRGNLQVVDLKQVFDFMAYPKQLVCMWILHIKTAIREMKIKTEFAKLTNRKKIKGQLSQEQGKVFPNGQLR